MMKILFSNRFFFISLLLTSCPSIFIKTSEEGLQTANQIDPEHFKMLMESSHEHTETIGWVAQQILQTLCTNKEQYQIKNKEEVVITLKSIQDLAKDIDVTINSRNTTQDLAKAAVINNGLIHFLSKGLDSQFKEFDISAFLETLQKRSLKDLSDQTVINIIEKNNQDIKSLLSKVSTTGLTWYNLLYRKIKEYNVYNITKQSSKVLLLGALLLSYTYCVTNTNPDGKFFFSKYTDKLDFVTRWADRYIGGTPYKDIQGEWHYRFLSNNNEMQESSIPSTIFQTFATKTMAFTNSGFGAITPLFTISLPAIYNYCFGDAYNWTTDQINDNIHRIDEILNGSQPNKNINDDGQEKVYFEDLIGCEELQNLANQLADFVENPSYYERSRTETHRGILLHGPPQTGKSNFAKALRTLIQDRFGNTKKIGFIDGKSLIDRHIPIDAIFEYAAYAAPCILFLDEIDLIAGNREKDPVQTGKLLTCMQGIDITSKQIIVIGATNRVEQLDKALLVDGRFGKQILIDYPEYKYRKQFFKRELAKRALEISDEFIDHMAQETDGCSYNNLRRIITEAIIISGNERRPICQNDFEKTLDIDIRKIYFGSRGQSTEEEKNIIAAYQAGKALVRHLLNTDKEIVKITIENVARTIKPKKTGYAISLGEESSSPNEKIASEKSESKTKLGEVFAKSKNNKKDFISDQEIEKEILVLLAGNIAQQTILKQSYSQCNTHDRADAMQMIYETITHGEKIDEKIREQALIIKDKYEKELFIILEKNKELLLKITNALVKDITINRNQWIKLIA
ncbi:AAA family ATPase [Candidatus Dependentiae bacterium]|nr:AAA family ATPase [Candidatus Dependentiae bacterium]